MSDKWGAGDPSTWNVLHTCSGKIDIEGQQAELFFGEFPHSRQDNNIYAKIPDGEIVGFDGHRPIISFSFTAKNYVKRSGLSGNEVRKGGVLQYFINGSLFYSQFCRDPIRAAVIVTYQLPLLREHPLFWEILENRVEGRLVFYREIPAILMKYDPEGGAVLLRTESGRSFPPPVWREENDVMEETDMIRTDLFDEKIWWFRGKAKEN